MTGEPVGVEATGETVGEAKWAALRELERRYPGLDKSAVEFDVLSEGERGLLGVGYAPARVAATVPAPDANAPLPAHDESELASDVRELLEAIAAALGVGCRIDVHETDAEVVATCSGAELGVLIGRHGQTIDAVQHLVAAAAARPRDAPRKEIVVDAAGYRARRRATLEALAERAAERVRRSGEEVQLEPRSAPERRIVHTRLAEEPGVETRSEGAEPTRYVVVAPAADDAPPRAAGRTSASSAGSTRCSRHRDSRRSPTGRRPAGGCSPTRSSERPSSPASKGRSSTSGPAAGRRASRSPRRCRSAR